MNEFPKIRYAPRESAAKFCSETGKPKPPMTTHWLEWDNDGYWSHLGIISDVRGMDASVFGKRIEAMPEMLEALKEICRKKPQSVSREEAADMACEFWIVANEALAKAEGKEKQG